MLPAFPKPHQAEGKVTLSPKERAKKRVELYYKQRGICADCGGTMTLQHDRMDSCTLDHIIPEPAGCPKNDADSNLRDVCFQCNSNKGSKRL